MSRPCSADVCTRHEVQSLRERLEDFKRRTGLGWSHLAHGSGLGHAAVYYLATGARRPSRSSYTRLVSFMDHYLGTTPEPIERAVYGPPPIQTEAQTACSAPRNFHLTRTAREVISGLNFCAERHLNGVVLGDPGVGKTAALEYWSATSPYPHVVVYCRAYTGYFQLVRALAGALNLGHGRTADLDDLLHEELAVHPRMLLLDEADMLGAKTLDWLRTLWDASDQRANFFLTAKPAFYQRMQTAHVRSRQHDLRQLWRRIAFRRFVTGIDRCEMDEVLAARGLPHRLAPDAAECLYKAIGGSFGELEVYLALIAQLLEENPRLAGRVKVAVVEAAQRIRFGGEFASTTDIKRSAFNGASAAHTSHRSRIGEGPA